MSFNANEVNNANRQCQIEHYSWGSYSNIGIARAKNSFFHSKTPTTNYFIHFINYGRFWRALRAKANKVFPAFSPEAADKTERRKQCGQEHPVRRWIVISSSKHATRLKCGFNDMRLDLAHRGCCSGQTDILSSPKLTTSFGARRFRCSLLSCCAITKRTASLQQTALASGRSLFCSKQKLKRVCELFCPVLFVIKVPSVGIRTYYFHISSVLLRGFDLLCDRGSYRNEK